MSRAEGYGAGLPGMDEVPPALQVRANMRRAHGKCMCPMGGPYRALAQICGDPRLCRACPINQSITSHHTRTRRRWRWSCARTRRGSLRCAFSATTAAGFHRPPASCRLCHKYILYCIGTRIHTDSPLLDKTNGQNKSNKTSEAHSTGQRFLQRLVFGHRTNALLLCNFSL